jgi:beta-glucosidase-like glycosyl hydrolase
MSDGPAGIRITNSYVKYSLLSGSEAYDPNETYYTATYSWSGNIYHEADIADEAAYKAELEKGTNLYVTDGTVYYQYCTAFPIGTLLAMTWDPTVIEEVGRAIQTEMLEYGVTSFLAPGMNIHRNPLCGRNFEYYSEDPLVVGLTAAAETRGVQTKADGSYSGCGVTIKHFAFNNQEASRSGSNSVVSERAAREIYLKGFEIAVKTAQPDYIMTSYNMVNGYSTFLNYGLVTEMLRNEWGFKGFVMTDWGSVNTVYGKYQGQNIQGLLMYAGNDCEMPGSHETLVLEALEANTTMRLGDLQRSAINMINVISKSAVFEEMKSKLDNADSSNGGDDNNGGDDSNGGDSNGGDTEKDQTIADLQDKLDAADKAAAENKTQIEDLTKKLAEAQANVDKLTAQINSTPAGTTTTVTVTDPTTAADLKAAQEELATVKAQLEAAQKEAATAAKVTIATDKSSYSVKKGKSFKITAVSSNGKKITYTSKNKKIAKVTSKGKVTGVKKGSTKIVVKVGSVKKTVKVTVK